MLKKLFLTRNQLKELKAQEKDLASKIIQQLEKRHDLKVTDLAAGDKIDMVEGNLCVELNPIDTQSVDLDAVRAFYESIGKDVPLKDKTRQNRLTIKPYVTA